MSIVRYAARLSAVEAVRGRTLVGDNVLDSEIGALDIGADGSARTDQDKPFISVYIDSGKVTDGQDLRSLTLNGRTDIIFEASIASSHAVTNPDTDESVIYEGLPSTDANFEFQLDLTIRQICDALTDEGNEWADIFRAFCRSFVSVERHRLDDASGGVRLAAHQIKITADMIADPARGRPLNPQSPFARFIAKCESDLIPARPKLATNIDLLKAQVAGSADELATAIRRYGLTLDEAGALLLTDPE